MDRNFLGAALFKGFLFKKISLMLCLQYELLNVSANGMIGKMTLYTDGRNRVSHQCELSNVNAADVNEKMTLNSEGRYEVSRRCEHLNVSASYENLQRFLYRGSTQMLCLQYELSYVRANKIIGKTT